MIMMKTRMLASSSSSTSVKSIQRHLRLRSSSSLLLGRNILGDVKNNSNAAGSRSYHHGSVLSADALDMTDTFARRHSK
jgi:hypothetical protein